MAPLGLSAVLCYAIHAGFHLLHGRPEDLLWACHLGALLVGAGLLCSSQLVLGIGTLWLMMGTPLWLLDLAGGGQFLPTSLFTHVGGLLIALCAVRTIGLAAGTWWKAAAALAALIAICRLLTPEQANVNVAFAIHPASERYFSSHLAYIVTMIVLATGYFFVIDLLLRRWFVRQSVRGPGPQGTAP